AATSITDSRARCTKTAAMCILWARTNQSARCLRTYNDAGASLRRPHNTFNSCSERARVPARTCRIQTCHRRVVVSYLGLSEKPVVDRDLTDSTLEPSVH